eukprot:NODE_7858_length_305_cov_39.664062_g7120_i0.p3 GENE.NODE_7858_length_305_cov_39.664062_g7120_i0~~NODE_7858_length_305_cov_39.664062_g7120_i0.p3  ORF type:complete len:63 (+),score=12.51 NODE_7858_length_305_cov_39.664062_g7120_i0:27-215(+)
MYSALWYQRRVHGKSSPIQWSGCTVGRIGLLSSVVSTTHLYLQDLCVNRAFSIVWLQVFCAT